MADPELSEDELFDGAVGDAPADVAAAEPAGEAAEQGQARDEAGRFAEKPAAETVAEGDQTAKSAVDDNAAMVPSWRVREINDEKRTLADRLAALEADKANWQRQQPQPKPVEATKQPEMPDPLLQPKEYGEFIEARIEARILNDRRDLDLEMTRQANTEAFDKAHNEAMRLKAAGDPAFAELSQKMQSSLQPGKVLLGWHQDRSVRAEIGGDLATYKQRLRDEALKDPEFRKAAIAAWQADAQPTVNGRPRVDLPPSLNGASRSNAALRASQTDLSDDALFDQTTA